MEAFFSIKIILLLFFRVITVSCLCHYGIIVSLSWSHVEDIIVNYRVIIVNHRVITVNYRVIIVNDRVINVTLSCNYRR